MTGCGKKAHLKHFYRRHGGGIENRVADCDKWPQRQSMCMMHPKLAGGLQLRDVGTIGDSNQFGQNLLSLPPFPTSLPLSLSTFLNTAQA